MVTFLQKNIKTDPIIRFKIVNLKLDYLSVEVIKLIANTHMTIIFVNLEMLYNNNENTNTFFSKIKLKKAKILMLKAVEHGCFCILPILNIEIQAI